MNRKYTFSTLISNNRSPTNPSFYINPSINGIESFLVSNFQGVNNVYTFDSRNCNLRIQETGQTAFSVVIPSGNYTIASLLTTLKTILDGGSAVNTFTVTKSDLTNKITIVASSSSFYFLETVNDCFYELGFVFGSSASLTQLSTFQYDLSGLKTIHIISNDLGNDGCFLMNSNYNIICSIPIDAPYLSPIHFQDSSNILINCKVNELSSISFRLLDERFRLLNNVSDWSVQLIANFQ